MLTTPQWRKISSEGYLDSDEISVTSVFFFERSGLLMAGEADITEDFDESAEFSAIRNQLTLLKSESGVIFSF